MKWARKMEAIMSNFFRILRFEFSSITAKKSWIIPTAIFVLVALIVAFIPQIFSLFGSDLLTREASDGPIEPPKIGLMIEAEEITPDEIGYFLPQAVFYDDEADLAADLMDSSLDEAYIIHSADAYSPLFRDTNIYMGPPGTGGAAPFEQVMRLMRERRLIGDALDFDAFRSAMDRPFESTPRVLGTDGFTNYGFTYGFIFVVYFLVIFYGTTVSTSVAREKSDRTMELLITSANPSKLFYGKVFGAGLAGLLQFSLIVVSLFAGFRLNQAAWGFNIMRYLDIPPKVLIIFLGFTLLGYLLYLFFYAMLASTVSKVEDVSTASMPIMLLMVASFLVVNFSMSNPDSLIMKVASFIPFSSPFAMFARSSLGSTVTNWEIILGFIILLVTMIFTAFISARLYRLGTLNYGNRLKLGEAIRLLRQDAD